MLFVVPRLAHPLSLCSFRRAFCFAFGISEHLLKSISEGMKAGSRCHTTAQETAKRPELSLAELKEVAAKYGLSLDKSQLQAGVMPNSSQAFLCKYWMADYFHRCGDPIPNSDNEV